jgi:signal transduction histidine kinase
MMKLDQVGSVGPQVSGVIDDFGRRILEQQAELADSAIFHKLLMELVMSYVQAEHDLRDLNELKNRFLGMAAHDLRNPLSAIRGMSELMLGSDWDKPRRNELLQVIHDSSNEMLRLVNELLDVAVIESGKLEIRLAPANLATLASNRMRLLAPAAEKKHIALEPVLETVPDSLLDAVRIGQVIDNVVNNAIKFAPGGTTVRVAVRRAVDGLEIAVLDQGPGLSASDQQRLFGTFERLTAQPTGGEQSTGLGLAIAKKIVDAHRGSITVRSELGYGAEFVVTLPFLAVQGSNSVNRP